MKERIDKQDKNKLTAIPSWDFYQLSKSKFAKSTHLCHVLTTFSLLRRLEFGKLALALPFTFLLTSSRGRTRMNWRTSRFGASSHDSVDGERIQPFRGYTRLLHRGEWLGWHERSCRWRCWLTMGKRQKRSLSDEHGSSWSEIRIIFGKTWTCKWPESWSLGWNDEKRSAWCFLVEKERKKSHNLSGLATRMSLVAQSLPDCRCSSWLEWVAEKREWEGRDKEGNKQAELQRTRERYESCDVSGWDASREVGMWLDGGDSERERCEEEESEEANE